MRQLLRDHQSNCFSKLIFRCQNWLFDRFSIELMVYWDNFYVSKIEGCFSIFRILKWIFFWFYTFDYIQSIPMQYSFGIQIDLSSNHFYDLFNLDDIRIYIRCLTLLIICPNIKCLSECAEINHTINLRYQLTKSVFDVKWSD